MLCNPCPVCSGDVALSPGKVVDGRRNYMLTCWCCHPEGLTVRVIVPTGMPLELAPRIGLALGAAWNALHEIVSEPAAVNVRQMEAAAMEAARAGLASIRRRPRGEPP